MPDLPPQWAAVVASRTPPLLDRWYADHGSEWLPIDAVRRWAQVRAPGWVRDVRTERDMRRLLDQEPKLVPGYRLRTRRDRAEGGVYELGWFVERSSDPCWEREKMPLPPKPKHARGEP